ncbi:hypothetical protein M0C34_07575 [Agarivorans sp. TSD2052]|uniref:hypothetical protein n=1 Tax=Agarivorans sp. TSD2052 TaxID=2937286 RepID=UPI00200E7D41|nr:hypothetical protein [Agarivorans sp. TSD2052]UPW20111.1 hypothetical protein M0C34_07575 [Agarivorans sp. TSD2052]
MAFDKKFLSLSEMRSNFAFAIYIYFPTLIFAFVGTLQFLRGRNWPIVAFTAGLFGTAIFHQCVVGFSYGNPGYMVPGGHIVAPLVSIVAYLFTFLIAWGITRVLQRKRRSNSQIDENLV